MMMIPPISDSGREVIQRAQEEARALGCREIGGEHILLALTLVMTPAREMLMRSGIGEGDVRDAIDILLLTPHPPATDVTRPMPLTPEARMIITRAREIAAEVHSGAGPEALVVAILDIGEGHAFRIIETASSAQALARNINKEIETARLAGARSSATPATDVLGEFCEDMTARADEGMYDPVIGREADIDRLITTLCRRRKSSPVILGPAGSGKSALARELARRIANDQVPSPLRGVRLLGVDMAQMIAGTNYRGEFEERLKALVQAAGPGSDVILFIDEIHGALGASARGMGAADVLKPALARGDLTLIGASTEEEYRTLVRADEALDRRLCPVVISAPSRDEAVEVLVGIGPAYAQHHNVMIGEDVLEEAVDLAIRYLPQRALPDAAIDLIDEAAARRAFCLAEPGRAVRLLHEAEELSVEATRAEVAGDSGCAREKRGRAEALLIEGEDLVIRAGERTVTRADLLHVVSMASGISVRALSDSRTQRLRDLEAALSSRVIGQQGAISAVSRAVRRQAAGLANGGRPAGSFLFLGPTGVGKTEVARALAEELFRTPDALVALDMSEYMEEGAVSRLLGSPPGYVGHDQEGALSAGLRRHPECVLLFDEVDKAHPKVLDILLQLLEEGHITDSTGRRVDARGAVVIMTANVGQAALNHARPGFAAPDAMDDMTGTVMREMTRFFRPELVNRLDEVVVFQRLGRQDLEQILDLQLARARGILAAHGATLTLTPAARGAVIDQGYDPVMGARPLRRAVMRLVEDTIADLLLAKAISDGDEVALDVGADGLIAMVIPHAAPLPAPAAA